MKGEQDSESLM